MRQDAAAAGQWDQRLRELRYHPGAFVDVNEREWRWCTGFAEIIADKRHWVRTPKTPENARERHLAIVAANEALQPFVAPLREQIERERDDLQQRQRGEAILRFARVFVLPVSAAAF